MEDGRGNLAHRRDPSAPQEYGIFAGGLSAREQTIFRGVVRLAEHDGCRFRFEDNAAHAHVLLLDGASDATAELIRTGAVVARRAIVIDPRPGLAHLHVLWRPIHWMPLLRLLEQMVGGARVPAAGATQRAAPEHSVDRLDARAVEVLRRYLGPAAEFVVEDAAAAVAARAPDRDRATAFLAALRAQLHPSLDPDRIVAEIAAAAGVRRF